MGVALSLSLACESSAPVREQPAPPVASPAPSPARSTPPAREPGFFRAADLEVLEVVTAGADARERLPLVVAVHGLGDRPENFASLVRGLPVRARVALPRAPEAYAGGYSWFAFRSDMSADELAAGIRRAADRLARAIDQVVRQRPTDGRPIVTGFSQGGMLSFAIAARNPSQVRAVFPVGGRLPEELLPRAAVKDAPRVVALHGELDQRVPIAPARAAIGTLRERGYDASLIAFPDAGHSIPPEMQRRLHGLIQQELARP